MAGLDKKEYDGFQYLVKTKLEKEAEEEGGKAQELVVYVPKDEYAYESGSRSVSEKMGMHFTVELDPILQYQAEDYTPAENLDYYTDMMFNPEYVDYADLKVEKAVEDASGKGARAVVTYCQYDEYEEEPVAVYATYYLREMDRLTVLVEAKITNREATGKLPGLLDEVEAFYGFRPEWDAAAADAMAEKADFSKQKKQSESSAGTSSSQREPDPEPVKNGDGTFTASGMTFPLPEGWDIDETDGEQTSFAPDGDAAFSSCMLLVTRQYSGVTASSMELFQDNPEMLEEIMEASMGSAIGENFDGETKFKVMDTTPFGSGMKMTAVGKENGIQAYLSAYLLFDDEGYLYMMMAVDTEEDQPAFAALETVYKEVKQS